MTGFSGGFLRDDSGALVVVPFASATAPTSMSESFVRDATGALVTGSTAPLAYSQGFVRDANLSLATVDVGSAISPAMSQGFIRDSSGALVTVDEGSAVAPTGYSQGFVRDANYSLVTTGSHTPVITFVKAGGSASNGASSGVSSLTVTVPAGGHAAGNVLFVAIMTGNPTLATPSGVTDSKGNTYTVDNTLVGTLVSSIAHSNLATGLVAGDTITVTWAASTGIVVADTVEFSGVAAVPLDKTASNPGTAATSLDGGTTAALSQAVEVAFGVFSCVGATGGSTAGTGWTKLNDITAGSAPVRGFVWEYQITSSTAAVDSTATIVTAHSYDGTTTTYKGA